MNDKSKNNKLKNLTILKVEKNTKLRYRNNLKNTIREFQNFTNLKHQNRIKEQKNKIEEINNYIKNVNYYLFIYAKLSFYNHVFASFENLLNIHI